MASSERGGGYCEIRKRYWRAGETQLRGRLADLQPGREIEIGPWQAEKSFQQIAPLLPTGARQELREHGPADDNLSGADQRGKVIGVGAARVAK